MNKSSLEEIEQRFDADVERFANLETSQANTIDAVLNMELITDGIKNLYPDLGYILDIGCGAGNYAVKTLMKTNPKVNVDLVDLSLPMLERAKQRVEEHTEGEVEIFKGDFRTVELTEGKYDVIIATMVLHHLRDDADWETSFARLYKLLRPGGSIWIFDMVEQNSPEIQQFIYHERYGDFLINLKDQEYQKHVFAYIEKEDSPRPLVYQLQLLEKVGFQKVDVLHKHLCFASFIGFK
ncbi:class I SAM-dependent methyltransferase [Sphingobacterium cellulitidis]|uniref:class I SAM-dependent methyltransferase n=1 Tax=Sphingobacterium cellulitidis TaxID=1768011 RepID=UPI003C7B2DD7